MSTPVGANGENFAYPTDQEVGYASQATGWAQAVTAALDAIGRGRSVSVNPKAVVDMVSTSKGLLIPRMTTVQISAISSPPESLLVYDTTQRVFKYYRNSAWVSVGSFVEGNFDVSGTGVFGSALSALSLAVTNAITAASATLTGAFQALTGNFTDATDAVNADTAPLKTLGGMAVKKKLFVGTDLGVGGDANITGKALTGDGLVSAPTYSFINDSDTGLFRIGANNIGFVAGGVQTSQLNSFGVLNGTPGTDFRNLIKRQYSVLTGSANTQSTSEVSTGIGFSYTPINAGSKLKINISITHQTSYNTQNATPSFGFLRLYSTTGSIPTAGNSPTGTAISSTIINTRAYNFSPYLWDNSAHLNLQFWIDSLNINARNIYLVHSVGTSNLISTVYGTSYHCNYMVEEYI